MYICYFHSWGWMTVHLYLYCRYHVVNIPVYILQYNPNFCELHNIAIVNLNNC